MSGPDRYATTRERLLDEAARLFRMHGYAGTSTRALSESLGLTKGALYHHVRSKDDLLLELCLESLTRIDAAVTLALSGDLDALGRLRAAIVAHVVSALEHADMHATMLIEMRSLAPANHELVRRARSDYEARIRGLVEAAQREGRLADSPDSKWMTIALLNSLNWSIFWYHPDGGLSSEEIGRVLADVYLYGVAADSSARSRTDGHGDGAAETSQLDRVEAKLDQLLSTRARSTGSARRAAEPRHTA